MRSSDCSSWTSPVSRTQPVNPLRRLPPRWGRVSRWFTDLNWRSDGVTIGADDDPIFAMILPARSDICSHSGRGQPSVLVHNHEGEVLESFVTKALDKKAALKFLRNTENAWPRRGLRHRRPALLRRRLERDRCCRPAGNRPLAEQQGRELTPSISKAEARDAVVPRMPTLRKFASVHASVLNHFNQERTLSSRPVFKAKRAAALAEWRGLCAA